MYLKSHPPEHPLELDDDELLLDELELLELDDELEDDELDELELLLELDD
jgi:hypothetical protein